jgi:hypothetical protein
MPGAGGRPRKYETAKAFKTKCSEYFEKGGRKTSSGDRLYTVSGLCIYLRICRDTLCEYEKRPEFSDTIKNAKQRIENCIEELSLIGEIDKTTSIFNLKYNFRWRDKEEQQAADNAGELAGAVIKAAGDHSNGQ